jgi:addiction module HigA family antidote
MNNPLHPGKIVWNILVSKDGAGLSVTEAAHKLDINRTTLSRLINGHAGISPDMALRLSKLLPNTDMVLWMNLQRDYDIWVTKKYSTKIRIKPLKAA